MAARNRAAYSATTSIQERALVLPALLLTAALMAVGCNGAPPATDVYSSPAYWTGAATPGGAFERPFGVAAAPDGGIYVTDARHRVVRLSSSGAYLGEWGHAGNGPGEFSNPVGVAVGQDGFVYVSDYDQDRVQKFTADGRFLLAFGTHGAGPGQFDAPAGVAIDRQDHVYVADFYNSRAEEFSSDGRFIRSIGHTGRVGSGTLHYPTAVATLADGGLIVADAYNYDLQWFAADGRQARRVGYRLLWLWPRPAAGRGGFNVPTGVAVGPHGLVHVADSANHRVVMLSPEGRYLGDWKLRDATPKVYSPEHIAVSTDGATAYATDFSGNRIVVLHVEERE
ncbi:MAG: NHL repeat-containing protein [Deltaproteobacteria bacterium]|nr:NHL repeat-containing protein [Deltaproteobacteria bacterium]